MKYYKAGLLFIVVMLISSSCNLFRKGSKEEKETTKPIAYKDVTEIVFGWGGGFTGMVEEYRLSKDGTLKLGDEVKKKLDNKSLKTILSAFKKVNFGKTKLNDPGNLYYFLAAKSGTNENRLIWNDQTQLPPEVKLAYDKLVEATK